LPAAAWFCGIENEGVLLDDITFHQIRLYYRAIDQVSIDWRFLAVILLVLAVKVCNNLISHAYI
jgi:hypothetical protein